MKNKDYDLCSFKLHSTPQIWQVYFLLKNNKLGTAAKNENRLISSKENPAKMPKKKNIV